MLTSRQLATTPSEVDWRTSPVFLDDVQFKGMLASATMVKDMPNLAPGTPVVLVYPIDHYSMQLGADFMSRRSGYVAMVQCVGDSKTSCFPRLIAPDRTLCLCYEIGPPVGIGREPWKPTLPECGPRTGPDGVIRCGGGCTDGNCRAFYNLAGVTAALWCSCDKTVITPVGF
jgi:hypothetical protein